MGKDLIVFIKIRCDDVLGKFNRLQLDKVGFNLL